MFATPNAGDVVTVTTRYSEGYIFADSEWHDTTYENVTVIRGPDWKPSGSFCVPCEDEPYITFRTIAMKNVHEILINGQPGKTVEETVYQTVDVDGSKGNKYVVTLENGVAQTCECVGFKFRHECKHLKAAEDAVIPEVVDISSNSGESTCTKSDLVVNKETHMTNLKSLSWGERFAIIEAHTPTDEQIQIALNIGADELATARELLEAGQFSVDTKINTTPYAKLFADIAVSSTDVDTPATVTATSPRKRAKPASATKAVKVAKKRGRKGTKIQEAFAAISSRAVSAENFAVKHGVSLNVLRQAKRFDRSGLDGRVRVKQIKGVLSIYREV